jgi:hypothetical protein
MSHSVWSWAQSSANRLADLLPKKLTRQSTFGASALFLLWQGEAHGEVAQLPRRDLRGRSHEQVLRLLVHGKHGFANAACVEFKMDCKDN